MIKITLDTNCIINLLDYKSQSPTSLDELFEIIRYALESNVNLAITTRVSSDIENDKNDDRREELLKRLSMFPAIGTVMRLGVSKLGLGDVLSGEQHEKLEKSLKDILFPGLTKEDKHYSNKINDIDHLIGHVLNSRDIFVTDDQGILRKSDILKTNTGLVIMNPEQCVKYINLKANKLVLIKEFYEKLQDYKRLFIETIDHSNFNDKSEEYKSLREWILKKYPTIKDGLLKFKLGLVSIPTGGQAFCDNSDLLYMQNLNEKILSIYSCPNLKEQIEMIADSRFNEFHSKGIIKKAIEKYFQDILDLLLSYSGYLEENF